MRLNGGMNRFDPVDKSMTYDPSSKSFVKEDDIGAIPTMTAGAVPDAVDAQADESDEPLEGEEADYAGEE